MKISAQVNGATKRLTIGFIMRSKGELANEDPHFAAMDIGWAQELLGRSGRLDSDLPSPRRKAREPKKVAAELRKIVPADVTVAAPAQRGEEVEKMLAGFQLNLAAMSLVSLLVGMFLIYNTIEASVVRRRSEIGILRSLGATRGEVRGLFLGEAVVLGLGGIALGMVGGYFLARALVGTVAETISSLYVLVSVQQIVIAPWVWLSAFLLGLGSVLLAAWLPAQAAAATNPVEALHGGVRIERSVHLSRGWIFGGALSLAPRGRLLVHRAQDRAALARFRCGIFCSRRIFARRAGSRSPVSVARSGRACAGRSSRGWPRKISGALCFATRLRSRRWPQRWR